MALKNNKSMIAHFNVDESKNIDDAKCARENSQVNNLVTRNMMKACA